MSFDAPRPADGGQDGQDGGLSGGQLTAGAPGQFGSPPPAYVGWATVAMVCGVLFSTIFGAPAGFVARRYGRQVRRQWDAGDQQAAIKTSRIARNWAVASTALDVIGLILLVLVIVGGSSSQSDFHNPSAVATSLKTLIQKRLSDPSSQYYAPGVTVTSLICTAAGTNTDTCTEEYSNGQSGSETAVISANGQSFVTR